MGLLAAADHHLRLDSVSGSVGPAGGAACLLGVNLTHHLGHVGPVETPRERIRVGVDRHPELADGRDAVPSRRQACLLLRALLHALLAQRMPRLIVETLGDELVTGVVGEGREAQGEGGVRVRVVRVDYGFALQERALSAQGLDARLALRQPRAVRARISVLLDERLEVGRHLLLDGSPPCSRALWVPSTPALRRIARCGCWTVAGVARDFVARVEARQVFESPG
mmetsp:Transcript_27614/g.69156  ORF Transcript_27614/g.69156 Transcript_27614/m.69156 type:complete len:225 (+) Transcript_27614:1193-1867(+)